MNLHVPPGESRSSARPPQLLLSTLICWDGQAALILASDADLWKAHCRAESLLTSALMLFENGREALTAVGARSVDAAHHEIPWGVDPAPFACPQLARYSPTPGYGIFEGIATANRAAALLNDSLPDFAAAGAFEISESLNIYSMATLAAPIESTSLKARALAEKCILSMHTRLSEAASRQITRL